MIGPGDDFLSILDQLPQSVGLSVRGDAAWLRCPFHSGGQETTPSVKLNLGNDSGYQYMWTCFACHEAGHWNRLAQHFSLPKIDTEFKAVGDAGLHFNQRWDRATSSDVGKFPWPATRDWRGISGKLLHKIGARVTATKSALDEPKMIIPAMQHGEEAGYISALLHDPKRNADGKKLEKSYMNSQGNWTATALLGFDIANKPFFKGKPLWVVEGPRDFLYMLSLSCRVVSILGSRFSPEKAELVRLLNPPAVLIGTDGDDAGDKAAQEVSDLCGSYIDCIRVNWGEGKDPVDQTPSRIRKINRMLSARYGGNK